MLNKYDIALLVVIGITSILWFTGMTLGNSGDANTLVVSVDGNFYLEQELDTDDIIDVSTSYGENVIEVKGGEIKMIEASCPDQYCVYQNKIVKANDTIVCLPNRLMIELKQKDSDIDAVVG